MSSTLRPRCAAEHARPGKSKPNALGINTTMLQPEPERACPTEIRNAKTMRGRCDYRAVRRKRRVKLEFRADVGQRRPPRKSMSLSVGSPARWSLSSLSLSSSSKGKVEGNTFQSPASVVNRAGSMVYPGRVTQGS